MGKKKNKRKQGVFEMSGLGNASKTLLANIRFASVDNPIKSFAITSSTPDEGKTTVATNLACAIASSGKRVLLVETDMRRRSIAHRLGLHARYGIYSLLTDAAKPQEAMLATGYENLYFLDSEPGIPSPPDILSTQKFANLVDTLEELFDYVIYDTPPVCAFVDAAIVGALVDGVILVVREHFVKRTMVSDAIQQLNTANAKILGVVLTFTNDVEHEYYYAYYNERGQRISHDKSTLSVGKAVGFGNTEEKTSATDPNMLKVDAKSAKNSKKAHHSSSKSLKEPASKQNADPMSLSEKLALSNLSHITAEKGKATNNPRENLKKNHNGAGGSLPVITDSKVKPISLRGSRTGKH